jgi:hypothetical protein
MPLLELAARSAWWDMDLAVLRTLSTRLRLEVSQDVTLLEQLCRMTHKVLPSLSQEDILAIVSQRLHRSPDDELDCSADLLDIDEAAKCLEKEDMELLGKEQVALESRHAVRTAFGSQYREAKAKLRNARAAKVAQGSRKAKAKASATRVLPPAMHMLSQSDAKQYLPPGGYVWRNRRDNSWHSQITPFGTCSRTTAKHGDEALHMVISDAWHKYCLLEGILPEDCPMAGLLLTEQQA